MKNIFFVVVTIVFASSCRNSGEYKKVVHDPMLYNKTVKKLNDIVLENNFPPMIAARNYAYANIAAYEVIAAGDKSYTSLVGQIHGLQSIPKPTSGKKVDYPLPHCLHFVKSAMPLPFPKEAWILMLMNLRPKQKMPACHQMFLMQA